ncbi:hypothetical protein L1887_57568 [Cichorium endivia]|nr:hypothetical protein L1887_57568 [Cichorium endivia]
MGHSHHHHGHHHHAHGAPVHHVHGAIPQMESGMLEVERLAAERGWSPAPMLNHHNQAGPSVRPASTAPGMIQLPAQAQPFTLGPDGHVQWNPTANSWNASRLIAPADAGHTIQRSMSAAPDVFHNMPPASPLLQGHGGQTAWALPQRSMSVSPGPAQHVQPPAFGHAPQPSGVPPPQFAPTGDNGPSLSAQPPFGGAQPSQPVYQAPIRETLPPMPEPQSITSANLAQFATPPMQSLPSGFPAGGASPIAGLATIDEDGESQAGTVKTLQKLPTMGKNGGGGGKGNSVSRNNIAQFEAMAEAEEDQEEVKRQMIAMGMQPDEDAFSAPTQNPPGIAADVRAADGYSEAVAANSAMSTNSRVTVDTAQTSSAASQRPRASDIFQDVGHREVSAEKERSAPVVTMASVEPSATVVERTQEPSADSQMRKTGESRVSEMRRSSITSLRRSSSSQGFGLEALETKLARSTTPKIGSSSQSTVVMANVGRTDSTSSPLASPVVRQEEGSRSRKNSALRSAALAREEAERKGVEQQARAAEERARQLEAEKASRAAAAIAAAEAEAAAAERAAAEREAKRIRQAEQQRQERERLAEEARRQHELRKLEEARAQEEAQRVAREEQLERERQAEMSASMHRSDGGSSELTVKPESRAIESRRLGNIGAVRSPSSTTSLERIQAAIAPAPSSIAPSVPSKTTRPTFGAPSRTSDRDRVVLKREAVHRIDGWLSNAASPNASHMNTPGTPSASVLSVLAKDEPRASASREDERRSSYSYRSPSQVINPLWEGKAAGSRSAHRSIPASQTMADLVSTKASLASQKAAAEDDEAVPQLSAELRALVDGSEIRSAHRTSTALKDHPISRRLSGIGSTQKPSEADAATASAVSTTEGAKRERHISMPSWPRPGTLNLDAARNAGQGSAAVSSSERRLSRNPEAREVAIPSRVEKTLAAPISGASASDKQPSYDARSARGGKGGRVASVAQLWSKIAGDDEADATNGERSSLAAPQGDSGPRSASPSSASTVKPKARRLSSASGGAPALDFSKKAATPSASVGVTAIVATFGAASSASKPESLKSFTAPQFLNTSVSKPVFAKVGAQPAPHSAAEAAATAASKPEKRPLPKPVLEPGAVPAPTLVRPTAMRASKAPAAERSSRRISTQLLSTFEKEKTPKLEPAEVASVRDMMSKVAVDSTILEALQANDVHDGATLRYADGTEIKMSGRGTTKAIGENKLKSLRARRHLRLLLKDRPQRFGGQAEKDGLGPAGRSIGRCSVQNSSCGAREKRANRFRVSTRVGGKQAGGQPLESRHLSDPCARSWPKKKRGQRAGLLHAMRLHACRSLCRLQGSQHHRLPFGSPNAECPASIIPPLHTADSNGCTQRGRQAARNWRCRSCCNILSQHDRYVPFAVPLPRSSRIFSSRPLVAPRLDAFPPDLIWPFWVSCPPRPSTARRKKADTCTVAPGSRELASNRPPRFAQQVRKPTPRVVRDHEAVLANAAARSQADVKPYKDQTQSVWHQLRVLACLARRSHRLVSLPRGCVTAGPRIGVLEMKAGLRASLESAAH